MVIRVNETLQPYAASSRGSMRSSHSSVNRSQRPSNFNVASSSTEPPRHAIPTQSDFPSLSPAPSTKTTAPSVGTILGQLYAYVVPETEVLFRSDVFYS